MPMASLKPLRKTPPRKATSSNVIPACHAWLSTSQPCPVLPELRRSPELVGTGSHRDDVTGHEPMPYGREALGDEPRRDERPSVQVGDVQDDERADEPRGRHIVDGPRRRALRRRPVVPGRVDMGAGVCRRGDDLAGEPKTLRQSVGRDAVPVLPQLRAVGVVGALDPGRRRL